MAIHGERENQRGDPDRGRGRLTRRSVAEELDCAVIWLLLSSHGVARDTNLM